MARMTDVQVDERPVAVRAAERHPDLVALLEPGSVVVSYGGQHIIYDDADGVEWILARYPTCIMRNRLTD